MTFIYVFLIVLEILLFIVAAKEDISDIEEIKSLEEPFYKVGTYLYKKGTRLFHNKRQVEESLEILYPRKNQNVQANLYYRKKVSILFQIIVLITVSACMIYLFGKMEGNEIQENRIARQAYEDGSKEIVLEAKADNLQEEIKFAISPKEYTEEELDILFHDILFPLDQLILADNVSEEEIRSDLYFPEKINNFPFEIQWETENYDLIESDGRVHNNEISEQGEILKISAKLSCQNFERQYIFHVQLMPPLLSEEEKLKNKIQLLLQEADQHNKKEPFLSLPEEIEGQKILWKMEQVDYGIWLLGLGVLLIPFLWKGEDGRLEKERKQRERELEEEYPEIVSKLALLLGAGLTLREAVRRISEGQKKAVYEEMAAISIEIEAGVSESRAYLHWGKRCYLKQYRKLAALLVQNLKKGSKGLLTQLENEAITALEERKSAARKKGEEAGTKLLLPMMGMLLVVMIIVVVPAFGSF